MVDFSNTVSHADGSHMIGAKRKKIGIPSLLFGIESLGAREVTTFHGTAGALHGFRKLIELRIHFSLPS